MIRVSYTIMRDAVLAYQALALAKRLWNRMFAMTGSDHPDRLRIAYLAGRAHGRALRRMNITIEQAAPRSPTPGIPAGQGGSDHASRNHAPRPTGRA